MIEQRIKREVARVATRYRRLWFRRTLSITWTVATALGALALIAQWLWGWHWSWTAAVLGGSAALGALVMFGLTLRAARDTRWVARQIESRYPALDARLLTALEQKPDLPDGRFGFLQQTVISEVASQARRGRWWQTVPEVRLRRARLASVVSFFGLAVVLTGLTFTGDRPVEEPKPMEAATSEPPATVEPEHYEVKIDPGNTEIERGSGLLVLARFQEAIPPEVTLVFREDSGEERRLNMSKSLDDPLFGGRLAAVNEDLSYHVEFARETSQSYRVAVFDYPELMRVDAKLVYPAYTALEPRTVVDTRHVSAVEGTELTWICHLNKAVPRAELLAKDGEAIALRSGDQEHAYFARIRLERSARYRVHLVDDSGRESRESPELVVRVLPNRRPDVKLVSPKRDVRVSPLEELAVEAKVWDDFGLHQYGLSYTVAGQPSRELVVGERTPGKDGREIQHLIDFEALKAEPDQLLSYHFWAEDVGPDGQPRRTFSDMYFAEVRHFEEIFRQGEQPPGGENQERRQRQQQQGEREGGQNAAEAERLAELQKQIVNGTWKLIRREAGDRANTEDPEGDFQKDAGLLEESQESALNQTEVLAENLQDAESRTHVEVVQLHMKEAIEKLAEAVDDGSPDPLRPALAAEQSAYQALLKLRAREHRVIRGRNQQQSSDRSRSSQNRSQRQLQQLQLSSSRNRYEMQRSSPRPKESRAQREDRQVTNRLRELARRQADLNKRLKELQSALAEAQDAEEREEIERRLKRLRDEEQRILRDTDELTQRMDQPENQERMADAREQLRDTRENVRRASEALREGRASRAMADGARAEREFNELRDEFRQRSARQFAEEMREMRADAERLDRNEGDLSTRLGQLTGQEEKSLRGSSEREQIEQGLEQQKQEIDGLLERMQETVKQAEKPEPLLAEKLYDTARQTRHTRTDESLDVAKQLLERGFVDEATQAERQARKGIRQLREGIEDAAESVLGDETEALRRARREIERLTDEVEREIARATSSEPGERRGTTPDEGGENRASRAQRSGQGEASRDRRDDQSQPNGERLAAGERGPRGRREAANPEEQDRRRGQGPGERRSDRPGENRRPGQEESPRTEAGGDRPAGQTQSDRPSEVARAPSNGPNRPGNRPSQAGDARRAAQPRDRSGGARNASSNREATPGRLRGPGDPNGRGGLRPFLDGADDVVRERAPIAGEDFRDWSDRLRDVEEMLDDPKLRAEAARVRDRARGLRVEMKRHSKKPNWDLVRMSVVDPLNELRKRVTDELLRRESKDSLVPIDGDPVPVKYAERVRKYYERLGSGR